VTRETEILESSQIQSSSLLDYLQLLISFRGPITVAEYMNHALLHPEFGYYTQDQSKGGAVFGKDHDFTTAPEISQMFSELLGIWVIHTAMNLGFERFHLVEIGPGRGTLMEDVVRTISQFSHVSEKLEVIHLVERSTSLRKLQKEKIQWPDVQWHETFSEIPGDVPCIVLAQELFDALPVHQFELTEHGWCERLVDILESVEDVKETEEAEDNVNRGEKRGNQKGKEKEKEKDKEKERDNIVEETNRVHLELNLPNTSLNSVDTRENELGEDEGDPLRFVLSPAPTNASRVYVRMFNPIPVKPIEGDKDQISSEAKEVSEEVSEESTDEKIVVDEEAIGSRLEVSPAGCALAQDIALRISTHGGAALFVDYGKDRASGDSLRGIQNHKFVSPLQNPGRVDLSIDVDFASLKAAVLALKIDGLNVYGTVGQGDFLKRLGIETRLHALLQTNITEEQAEALYLAYHRLTDPDEMGTVYRAMSMVSMPEGNEEISYEHSPPAGF
jgi:NADH dehydrogenase [ubiquinone] 1 alpha subcomplex assembly factor 7